MKVIFVRALYGKYTSIFKKRGFAAIGWFNSAPENLTRQGIINHYRMQFPDDSDATTYQNAGQIYRFWNEINDGDLILSTYNDGALIVGKAIGKPYLKRDDFEFCGRIDVKWNEKTLDRHQLSIGLQNTLKSSLTVFNVSQVSEVAEAAGYTDHLKNNPLMEEVSLDLNELIRSKILTLDPTEFELLVSKVLQSLGFEATQETGKVGDKGIDYEGVLEVNGVASIKLQVQVKRYDKSKVSASEIRNFRGSLKRDYQGTFITLSDFAKRAIDGASDPEMESIKLINGRQFVDLFVIQYEEIISLLNEDENDVLLEKLKFKKTLVPI